MPKPFLISGLKPSVWLAIIAVTVPRRVLVLKRSPLVKNGGQWNFPGGNVDPHESIINAALREGKEEIGHSIPMEALRFLDKIETDTKRMVGFVTYCDIPFHPVLNDEHSEHRWLTAEELRAAEANLHNPTRLFADRHFWPGESIWESSKEPRRMSAVPA